MLRSFENAIIRQTGASTVAIPSYDHLFLKNNLHHFGHGMKRGRYRRFFPKKDFLVNGDISWYILMGPENYRLDLFTNWNKNCKVKIIYLYDTLPAQYPLIKRLFSNSNWDILITSFNDAVDDLQKLTGRQWHAIEQAADEKLFQPVSLEQRNIHFSAYGRRYPSFHEALKEFCEANNLYYDYTTHDAKHPVVCDEELYKQYAWHLSHSLFTVSWPVEFTNASRSGHLSPVTCRWFEAAAAGTTIIGKKPANPFFKNMLADNLVVEIEPDTSKKEIWNRLDAIWNNRESLYKAASLSRQQNITRWTWDTRVRSILQLI